MLNRYKYLFIAALMSMTWVNKGKCQLVVQGLPIYLPNDGLIHVRGNIHYKDTSNIINHGVMELTGDWINESVNNNIVFQQGSKGKVVFLGSNQNINGSPTRFPNLVLKGSGIKKLTTDTEVDSSLLLDGIGVNINGHHLSVLSTDQFAVKSINTGYASTSSNKDGWFRWHVAPKIEYIFPMGDANVQLRYRPLSVVPDDDGYASVQFQNYYPGRDNYDSVHLAPNLDRVNDKFYHSLKFDSSIRAGSAKVIVPFSEFWDGDFETLATWKKDTTNGSWVSMTSSNPVNNIVPTADKAIISTQSFPSKINTTAIIVLATLKQDKLKIPNTITPNGDGKNDQFRIIGLDQYTGGAELVIYNRWGGEVYHSTMYANNWGGRGLNAGTYYYILRLRSGQKIDIRKGWVELIR